MLRSAARHVKHIMRFPNIELDELVSEGWLGVQRAQQAHPEKFSNPHYARAIAKGAMLNWVKWINGWDQRKHRLRTSSAEDMNLIPQDSDTYALVDQVLALEPWQKRVKESAKRVALAEGDGFKSIKDAAAQINGMFPVVPEKYDGPALN